MFVVYAIHNDEKFYIGPTNNMERRLVEHNNKLGNHYTARFDGAWELFYTEQFKTRSSAIVRDRQLKSQQGRQFLKSLVPG